MNVIFKVKIKRTGTSYGIIIPMHFIKEGLLDVSKNYVVKLEENV